MLGFKKMFLPIVLYVIVFSHQTEAVDRDLLNYCFNGKYHKTTPGPEDDLHKQCTPWKDRSCCTAERTRMLHNDTLSSFTFNHCPGRKLSDKCLRHFQQDHCFYECSPNVGPWVQEVQMKTRKERMYGAPLCASDCNSWFEDCKEDYTCAANWARDFVWENGKNVCPHWARCTTFKEMYSNASNFCEVVWDGSWKYTEDDKPCMRIWFDGSKGNPNDAVARYFVTGIHSGSTKTTAIAFSLITLSTFLGLRNSSS